MPHDVDAPSADAPSPFDAVVFAGGGCRCIWQAGFWDTAAPALGLAPRVVVGVSAGSAFACAAIAGQSAQVLADFRRRVAANSRNFYPGNLLRGEPIFPHEQIYRSVIVDNLDEETLRKLQSGPELRILVARLPPWLGKRSGVAAAVGAHLLNRCERRVHARWGTLLGFQPEVVSVSSCRTPEELTRLILHSSCAPPILPVYQRGDRIVLDGGLLDNAPVHLVGPARSTLVLLTFPFNEQKIPRIPGRRYVRPSRNLPIAEWDYTSPRVVQETYDLGRRDGESFVAEQCGFQTATCSPPGRVQARPAVSSGPSRGSM